MPWPRGNASDRGTRGNQLVTATIIDPSANASVVRAVVFAECLVPAHAEEGFAKVGRTGPVNLAGAEAVVDAGFQATDGCNWSGVDHDARLGSSGLAVYRRHL